jgi:hypothetical protein
VGRPWHPSDVPSQDTGKHRRFDRKRAQGLVDALGAPRIAYPTRDNLGLTVDWLRTNARRLLGERNTNFSDEAANLQRLQVNTFSDVAAIDRLLPGIFDSFHTDDYPSVRVPVTFANGGAGAHTRTSRNLSCDYPAGICGGRQPFGIVGVKSERKCSNRG